MVRNNICSFCQCLATDVKMDFHSSSVSNHSKEQICSELSIWTSRRLLIKEHQRDMMLHSISSHSLSAWLYLRHPWINQGGSEDPTTSPDLLLSQRYEIPWITANLLWLPYRYCTAALLDESPRRNVILELASGNKQSLHWFVDKQFSTGKK